MRDDFEVVPHACGKVTKIVGEKPIDLEDIECAVIHLLCKYQELTQQRKGSL